MELPKAEIIQYRKWLIPAVAGIFCLVIILIMRTPPAMDFRQTPKTLIALPQNVALKVKTYTSIWMPAIEPEPIVVDSAQEPDNLLDVQVKEWSYPDVFCFAGIFEEYDCMCGNWYDGYDQDAAAKATEYLSQVLDNTYTPVSAVYEGVNGGRALVLIQCQEQKIFRIAMDANGFELISYQEIWDQYWDTEPFVSMRNGEYLTYMREIQNSPGLG